MMKMILITVAVLIALIDALTVTPFGCEWNLSRMEDGKAALGFLFLMISAIPLMIILEVLKHI